jgi:arylsulfatase A
MDGGSDNLRLGRFFHLSNPRCVTMKLVFSLLALAYLGCELTGSESKRPNIVIIYADDLGYGDVQCYNPERGKIPTPHIDRLSREGMLFTDAHSSSGVCSPSRYTLLTGRYHWRSRLQKGIVGLWEGPLIDSDRLTIAGLAKDAGYETACVGKWHLGWDWPIPSDKMTFFKTGGYGGKKDATVSKRHQSVWEETFSQVILGGPTAVGFDSYFGVDVPNWPPYCFIVDDRSLGIPSEFADPSLFVANQASIQGPAIPGWSLEPILPALGRRTAALIERESKTAAPFLIYMSLTSPHTPLSVNDEWRGKSGLNLYADLVMETDAIVGQVLRSLEQNEVSENTLVVFTSDNGCAPYIGVADLEKQGHFPSGPMRGYKSDVWEGGHRVPFVVRWPGVVESGSRHTGLVHQADLIATIAEILGLPLPVDAGEDSFSFLATLKGGSAIVRNHAVSCSMSGLPGLRLDHWKFIPRGGSGGWSKGGEGDSPQLYNLQEDLTESNNLAVQYPAKVSEMASLLEKLIDDGRSNVGPSQQNDVQVKRYALGKN